MRYEYLCEPCNKIHEAIQKPNDEHKLNCPDCGRPARRKFNPTAFKFKFFYGWDESLGKYCDTQKDKQNYMRENKLIEQ